MKTRILFLAILTLCTELVQAQTVDLSAVDALQYRNVGPTRGGRVTAVTGDIQNLGTFYMGATGGGLWKTEDYGNSWNNVSDGYFESPSIGSVLVDPNNSDRILVGTGSDGIRSNVIPGKGVYLSDDGGKTWLDRGLKASGHIGAVLMHPENSDVMFVAALGSAFGKNEQRGIYKSNNAGESWDQVLYLSDSTGAIDLEFAPNDPSTIYASMWHAMRKPYTIISGGQQVGGIYKSSDGGDSWTRLDNGLPSDLIGKSDLAVSPAEPNWVWALVEAPQGEGGVFLSKDQGESWELINTQKRLLDRPFYYCNIDVNPQNANSVFVNATQFWHSTDGGKKFKRKRTPHGDNHEIWIHPNDSTLWVQGNDGGANVTRDYGKNWSTQNNQATAELYQVNVDDQTPYWLYAGQQDNSTISVPSIPPHFAPGGPSAYWTAVGGCETGPAIPKPGNPDIVYSNCKGRFGVYNKKTGQEQQYYVGAANMYGDNPKNLKYRFQRVSPIHVSPHNPDVIYHTSQFVHKSTDEGKTWKIISPDLTAFTEETQMISGFPITRDATGEEHYSTIYSIEESTLTAGVIWVGANDGLVHLTKDGGKKWKNVTPKSLPSGGRVQTVSPSMHDPAKAYATVYRYLLGDFRPYIYKTTNYGKSWTLLSDGSNGIPIDVPTRVVREDPNKEGLLYAGTEIGIFLSFDDGSTWQKFQQNLPVTPITDLKIVQDDLVISTMGRSFWIMDNIKPLRTVCCPAIEAMFFEPKDAQRMRYRGTSANTIPYYPSNGVYLDYFLPSSVSTLELKIKNNDGEIVRTFEAEGIVKSNEGSEISMATGFFRTGSALKLEKSGGSHRVRWDMRHKGPWHQNKKRSGLGGPIVKPGLYKAELIVDGVVQEQYFQVIADQRILDNGVSINDLAEQEALGLKLRDLMTEASRLSYEVSERLKAKKSGDESDLGKQILSELTATLETAEGRYQVPQLIAQLSYLNSMLDRADQKPGRDAYVRTVELEEWYGKAKAKYDAYFGEQLNLKKR